MNELADLKEKIRGFLKERFPLARTRGIQNNDPLLESGVLDSLGVLDVVSFAEKEFGIQVNDEELVPENFQTIDHLADFVLAKRKQSVGPSSLKA